MAIQFRCAQCGHPIEVDDEHAGQTAACPYCQHVMSVPRESTYQTSGVVSARPLERAPVDLYGQRGPAVGEPVAPGAGPTARQRAARIYGGYALVCALLALLLWGIVLIRAFMLLGQSGRWVTPPTHVEMSQFQQQAQHDPWIMGPQVAALFFALVGLILAVVSLTRTVGGNWRGVVAAVICSLMFLCQCFGFVVGVMTGMGMPASP
jgi:DNA-directed RNA polymerase subunit RPC12/RpoP